MVWQSNAGTALTSFKLLILPPARAVAARPLNEIIFLEFAELARNIIELIPMSLIKFPKEILLYLGESGYIQFLIHLRLHDR